MNLNIVNTRLSSISFDTCPTLYFGKNREYEIRIEQDFVIEVFDIVSPASFDLEANGEYTISRGANELVTFIQALVSEAHADDSGSLHLVFENIGKIDVPIHEKIEAWTYGSPDGGVIVSLPGGGLG